MIVYFGYVRLSYIYLHIVLIDLSPLETEIIIKDLSDIAPLEVYCATLDSKKLAQSCCSHPLDTSFATNPSHMTVGETWMPFCLENLAKKKGGVGIYIKISKKDENLGDILLYLRSFVTPVPPFRDSPLSVRRSLNAERASDGSRFEAS